MKLERMSEIETNDIRIGDRIHVGKYTATCQEITSIAAIFLLDQYLDKPMAMNVVDTNSGGYPESDLRKDLRSAEVLNIFVGIRDCMVPFENGDLLRIPFAGEIFGAELPEWWEADNHKQWPLMEDRCNRLASRQGKYEWGWLQNKVKTSSTEFCFIDAGGSDGWHSVASVALGVRPVFKISMRNDDTMTQSTTKKSAPENDETVRNVLDTFNETQRLVLYYIVGKAIEGEETILDVLDTLNDKQRLVLNYLVNKAAKDAKKGKTSESNEDDNLNDTAWAFWTGIL